MTSHARLAHAALLASLALSAAGCRLLGGDGAQDSRPLTLDASPERDRSPQARPAGAGATTRESAQIRQEIWRGWPAFRLSNGTVDAVVVPDIGRVMHYGLTDAGDDGNVLWTNRTLDGVAPEFGETWQNFGGDKVWPWPQGDTPGHAGWPTLFDGGWPPPAPFRGTPWDAAVDGDTLVLTLALAEPYGVRPVRTVRLDPENTGLVITSTFEPEGDDDVPAAGAWHVTQIARPGSTIVAVSAEGGSVDPHWMGDDDTASLLAENVVPLADVAGRDAVAVVPLDRSSKAGFAAPTLAAGMTRAGRNLIFVQHVLDASGREMTRPNDLAQVYIHTPDAGELESWSELEFAAPVGGTSRLSVRWSLHDTADRPASDPAVVAAFAADATSR